MPVMFVTITDENDDVLRRIDAPRSKGLHRIAWDLRYPRATKIVLNEGGDNAPLLAEAAKVYKGLAVQEPGTCIFCLDESSVRAVVHSYCILPAI